MKGDQRTVAFQVDAELFEKFKEFLKTKGIKQNAFFVDCILKALSEVADEEASQGEEVKLWKKKSRFPLTRPILPA